MRYKPMINASKGAHFVDSILCPLESKRIRWALWLNSVVSFSPRKKSAPNKLRILVVDSHHVVSELQPLQ